MYDNGLGVPKDYIKAAEWYQKAAIQEDAAAQYNLGAMYRLGNGVPKDYIMAVEWYQKAAIQGLANAQGDLGVMYFIGQGVVRDLVLSYAWRNLAASQGDGISIKARDALETDLTSAERAEGQRLASTWKKGEIIRR